ncbi:unnamed protein product [Coregonus sp. 'balchen']|nr:unnamed protein product [Coregonus sp. 'balchen']
MLRKDNMGKGVALFLLLLAVLHEARGQRRRKGKYSVLRDGGNDMATCSMEVAFILDSSEGAKTFLFEKQKSFVLHFSTGLTMLQVSGWTLRLRMAALQYSSSVSVEHSFTAWQDLDVFHSRVSSMAYIGHGTYSTYAITNATQLFTQETKEDSVRVAVLMTDGADHPRNPDVIGAAAEAKGSGVKLFSVGLSDLARQNSAKLRAIASTPAQQFVHSLTDPQLEEKLLKWLGAVALEACPQAKVCLCERGERGPPGNPGKKGDPGYEGPSGPKGSRNLESVADQEVKVLRAVLVIKVTRALEDLLAHGDPEETRVLTDHLGTRVRRAKQDLKGTKDPPVHLDQQVKLALGSQVQRDPQDLLEHRVTRELLGRGSLAQRGIEATRAPEVSVVSQVLGSKVIREILDSLDHKDRWECQGQGFKEKRGTKGQLALQAPEGIQVWDLLGQKGSQGFSGEPGIPGERGVGEPGPKGDPGSEGLPGIPGLSGEDGAIGQKGDIGSQGPRGPDGAPGKGVPGEKGDRGERGSRGQLGAVGPVGTMGAKGEPGSPGRAGTNGPPGRGLPGIKGDPGAVGPPGHVGEPGIGITGPKGYQGPLVHLGLKGKAFLELQDPLGYQDWQARLDQKEKVYLVLRETGELQAPQDQLEHQEGLLVRLEHRVPRDCLERAFKDQRGSQDSRGSRAPGGPPGQGIQGNKKNDAVLPFLQGDRGFVGERGRKGDKGETGETGAAGPLREEVIKLVRSICGCGVKCRESPLELVFVIDSSESVGPDNFNVVKDFVNALVDRASVSRETTRVGVVLYSHINMVVVSLHQQASRDQGTFTGSAIHQANQVFRAARPGVRKVAIVITDGQADERDSVRLEEAVKEANGSNIEMFVIGVVNQSDPLYEEFKKELHLMASDPDREHVYLIDDFRTLPALESKLLSRICESNGGAQFSSVPSSRYSPRTPGQAGIVRETPERTDTDTPTFNGDFKKTQMVPGPPGESDRVFIPQGPQTGDQDISETYRVPSFDREPFKRLPEFLLPSEVKNPTHSVVMTGTQAPTQRPLPVVKLPRLPPTSLPLPQDALIPDERCGQILDPGPCWDYVVKWYYDTTANACAQFWFGGCQGNQNQFESEKSCRKTCVKV